MTDINKAVQILSSTNNGNDLPVHQKKIVEAAMTGDLGNDTGARLIFEDLYEKLTNSSGEDE